MFREPPDLRRAGGATHRNRTIRIVGRIMAHQHTSVGGAAIGNRGSLILAHYVDVKIDEPFAGYVCADRTHSMGCVTNRARESVLGDMQAVLGPAGVGQNVGQIMTLGAHCVWTLLAQVRCRKQIGDRSPGRGSLAKLVIAFQDVRVDRAMRPIGTSTAKFAVVIAGMAVSAENLIAHQPR